MKDDVTLEMSLAARYELLRQSCNTVSIRYNFRSTEELKKLNPAFIIPTHCTGRKAIMALEKQMPDQFILSMAGTKLTFT